MQQTSAQKIRGQTCLVCGYALSDEAVRCQQCGTPVVDRGTQELEGGTPEVPTVVAAPLPASDQRSWLLTAAVTFVVGLTSIGLMQQIVVGPSSPSLEATYLVVNGRPEQLAWVMPDQAAAALAAQAVTATPRQVALLYAITQGTYERAFEVQGQRLTIGVAPLGAMGPAGIPERALLVRSYHNPKKGDVMLVAYVVMPEAMARDAAFQRQAAARAVEALNGLPIR